MPKEPTSQRDESLDEKTNATILGIVYHPELREISEGAKRDIAEMVRTLSNGLVPAGFCRVVKCGFAAKCDTICDWAKDSP